MSLLSSKFHMKGAARVAIKAAIIFPRAKRVTFWVYFRGIIKLYLTFYSVWSLTSEAELQGGNGKVYLLGKGVSGNLS